MSGRPGTHKADNRTPSQKDTDTLLYARSFLRLATVTQIATPDPLHPVIHNRLTHSLKVAQIARTIAGNLLCASHGRGRAQRDQRDLILSLGGLDASVAEAAGLAHDIGHPPFGHAGEAVLDRLTQESGSVVAASDGFEGNAQSFRCATKSDPMYELDYGLDLTTATRAAILKYPWPRPTTELAVPHGTPKVQAALRAKKFGYYITEAKQFDQARAWLPSEFNDSKRPRQSLEASIMDIADDITYAVHDYEDFLSTGALRADTVRADIDTILGITNVQGATTRPSVDALINEISTYSRFDLQLLQKVARKHRQQIPSLSLEELRAYNRELRNSLLDDLLGPECVKVSEVAQSEVGAHVTLSAESWHLVEMLKFFVKYYVINSSDLAMLQAGQGALLREGIVHFTRWRDDDPSRLPADLARRLVWIAKDGQSLARAYLDYICTLGDEQFEAVTLGLSGGRTTRFGSSSSLA